MLKLQPQRLNSFLESKYRETTWLKFFEAVDIKPIIPWKKPPHWWFDFILAASSFYPDLVLYWIEPGVRVGSINGELADLILLNIRESFGRDISGLVSYWGVI